MQPGFINITGVNLYLNIKEKTNFVPALAKFANSESNWFLRAERILDNYFRFLKHQLYRQLFLLLFLQY